MKKSIRLFVLILISLTLCLTLTSCKHINDRNGKDNFNLKYITDPQLLFNTDGVVKSPVKENVDKGIKYSAKKLSGVIELDSIKVNNEVIIFTISNKVESGNLKIAVTNGVEILKEINANETVSFKLINKGSNYYIKVAGESAKFEITYSMEPLKIQLS